MKNKHSKTGIASCVFAFIPFLGVFALPGALGSENELIEKIGIVIVCATLLASPVVGLILGIVDLIKKPRRAVLSIIGTILNSGWITFLIWVYTDLMTSF